MRASPIGFVTALLGGCSGQLVDTFALGGNIDVLFAIDKSGSMDDDARRLGASFGDFIDEVGAVTPNWQIGVVTTDGGCFNHGILTDETDGYEQAFLEAVTRDPALDPVNTEALLAMVDAALVKTGPEGCNAGFRRPNSILHIVTVSDEPEQSGRSAEYWIDRWQERLDNPDLLVISAIVDRDGQCGGAASGYVRAVEATGGLLLDLCTRDWPSFATELGQASADDLQTFTLSNPPRPTSIRVEVDGERYGDWRYDADENAVTLDDDDLAGSEIQIRYRPAGD